jgi:hypothetical protein
MLKWRRCQQLDDEDGGPLSSSSPYTSPLTRSRSNPGGSASFHRPLDLQLAGQASRIDLSSVPPTTTSGPPVAPSVLLASISAPISHSLAVNDGSIHSAPVGSSPRDGFGNL